MDAHQRAKHFRVVKDKERERAALIEARDLRLEALAQDPKRTDPAWDEEQAKTPMGRDTHDELMVFYESMLGDR
jgi:hypothetical protein